MIPDAAEKFVELNAAIPLVDPSAAALSIVTAPPFVKALLNVTAPVNALDPRVEPVIEVTPELVIVIAPPSETGEPETLIPVPLFTVIDEF